MIENHKVIDIANTDLLIFDLDGVIYKGPEPIKHVADSIKRYYSLNKKVVFFTNNSTLTRDAFTKKLISMNIECSTEQVYTSSTISSKAMSAKYSNGASAFVVGESGLTKTLEEYGVKVINNSVSYEDIIQNSSVKCDFVIAGLDRTFTYDKLAAATQLINRGSAFYATNDDSALPDKYGLLPGAGAILAPITVTTGKKPISTFGKPSPEGILQILDYFNIPADRAVMFGDRPETDILCAKQAGINSALVLTGVTTKNNIKDIPANCIPDIVINNLTEF